MKSYFTHDLTEITNETRLIQQKLQIIRLISQNGHGITIPEICKELKISAPTGIKLVNNLQKEGFLVVTGKKETANGRKPLIYSLKNLSFYALSVEILPKRVTVGIIDSHLNILYYRQKTDFLLEDSLVCLRIVEDYIHECLQNSGIKEDAIMGMGIGITGKVNTQTGETISYFRFLGKPISQYFSEMFKTPVLVNNNTRCLALAETHAGKARNVKNAIILNIGRTLGCSLLINNTILIGGLGLAGDLEHMKWGYNDQLCHCGAKGCLGNDVGGEALERIFLKKQKEGRSSKLKFPEKRTDFRYDHIFQAALQQNDPLCLEIIQVMALRLGAALGNLVNLINPELIILGGKFASHRTLLFKDIMKGMEQTALKTSLQFCQFEFSELGELGSLKGAGAMVFENFELVKH